MLSVIIPVFNEKNNLPSLVAKLSKSLEGIEHELIFIDDHSKDGSLEYLKNVQQMHQNIQILSKKGKRGKSTSLLEGIVESRGEEIAMIDADLQYPPEAIPEMYKQLANYDIVVGKRVAVSGNLGRRALTQIFNFFFGKVLLGLNVDVQSGLKVFRKQTIQAIHLAPTPWGFDYDFLYKAKRLGWKIGEVPIDFYERKADLSKVDTFRTGFELAYGAMKLRLMYLLRSVFKFSDHPHKSERFGLRYDNNKDFLFLPEIMSAKRHVYAETVSLVLVVAALFALAVFGLHKFTGLAYLVVISGILASFYVLMMFFKLRLIYHALGGDFVKVSQEELDAINPYDLPTYTILIPLYKEAEVIRQIIKAMSAIDYPADKLDIIITLEGYDTETIEAIANVNPPEHFKTLILPDVQPKTKPKALNVAFPHTQGEFLVIYDAEIIPDPDQLKKAYLAFQKYPDVDVLQTRLDHYNPEQSLVTRLFNEEFSFHFDMLLPGLQKLGYPVPLAGHSVHFRRSAIEEVGAWDPYNVTEDADMGIRLARARKKVKILDSASKEEATATISAWIGQRTRWIKGFIQTSIVHLRHPLRFKQELGLGWGGLLAFIVTVPASVLINISNLVYWVLLVGWFATHSHYIQQFFPGPIYYVSLVSFVAGNLIFVYLNLVSSYMRGRYSMVKYGLLSPLYWLMLAYASVKAAIELVIKPHHWSKTAHGKHLIEKETPERIPRYVIKPT